MAVVAELSNQVRKKGPKLQTKTPHSDCTGDYGVGNYDSGYIAYDCSRYGFGILSHPNGTPLNQ